MIQRIATLRVPPASCTSAVVCARFPHDHGPHEDPASDRTCRAAPSSGPTQHGRTARRLRRLEHLPGFPRPSLGKPLAKGGKSHSARRAARRPYGFSILAMVRPPPPRHTRHSRASCRCSRPTGSMRKAAAMHCCQSSGSHDATCDPAKGSVAVSNAVVGIHYRVMESMQPQAAP